MSYISNDSNNNNNSNTDSNKNKSKNKNNENTNNKSNNNNSNWIHFTLCPKGCFSNRLDCDPCTRSCLIPYCGRSFDSLQVLAWHMSYAHQDLSRTDEQSSLCYLCGYQMQTAKVRHNR